MTHASGTFEVRLEPQQMSEQGQAAELGRMSISKQFFGDLAATSTGEMLAAMTGVEASAGYVALERVAGSLHGRRGAFALQHSGLLDRGAQQLTITVVPDSGAGELQGIRGQMAILVEGGEHRYELEYTLP
jgi:hypothetical protein